MEFLDAAAQNAAQDVLLAHGIGISDALECRVWVDAYQDRFVPAHTRLFF
jgi:hypothetical protein